MIASYVAAYKTDKGWFAAACSTEEDCLDYLFNAVVREIGPKENPEAARHVRKLQRLTQENDALEVAYAKVFSEWFQDWFWVAET